MMSAVRPNLAKGAMLAVVLAVAACAPAHVPQSAMRPRTADGDFGYSEVRVAGDRYSVTYATPFLRLSLDSSARAAAIEKEKLKAYDLALWRAAQLVLEAGYPGFEVTRDRRNADVTLRDVPDGWGWGPWPYGRYDPYRYRDPWPYSPYYGPPVGGYRTVGGRVTVTLDIQALASTGGASALDARATADRLSKAYGSLKY
jgi:hypothetical protein